MSALTTLLGTTLPIIQAPMAGVQDAELAIAACEAGALGSLPAAMLGADELRRAITLLRSRTSRPFNVNFFCHVQPPANPERESVWRAALVPYYRELGLASQMPATAVTRVPFDESATRVIEELTPPVVSFHFGLPHTALLERVRRTGARVLSSATTVEEARWLEARGVDAIIAQGIEAGGHRGMFLTSDLDSQLGTLALVPRIVDAVRVPVIAAGGIADARGVAAAIALGAAGVQVGTAYLCCEEATTSAVHRAALLDAHAPHTALTNLFSGRPARGIVNRLMRELGPMSASVPEFPHASSALAPLRKAAEARGSGDFSPLWSGQNASGCRTVPAAKVTRELARGLAAPTTD